MNLEESGSSWMPAASEHTGLVKGVLIQGVYRGSKAAGTAAQISGDCTVDKEMAIKGADASVEVPPTWT